MVEPTRELIDALFLKKVRQARRVSPAERVCAVAEALEGEGVPYLLAGAFSVAVYGVPRSTEGAGFGCTRRGWPP